MVWVEVKKITYRRVLTAWLSLISEYNIKTVLALWYIAYRNDGL